MAAVFPVERTSPFRIIDCRYNPSRLRPTAPKMCPPLWKPIRSTTERIRGGFP